MAADPEEAVAEKDPSMPEGEGEVDLSVEGVEEVVADSDAASEAEAIVEEEEEEEKEEEVVDPMAEVKQEIKVCGGHLKLHLCGDLSRGHMISRFP